MLSKAVLRGIELEHWFEMGEKFVTVLFFIPFEKLIALCVTTCF